MKKVYSLSDGWSDWQAPVMQGYRMGCCDCGLVHDMEFMVVRPSEPDNSGNWISEEVTGFRVLMRARRNNRSTSAMRRKPKHG